MPGRSDRGTGVSSPHMLELNKVPGASPGGNVQTDTGPSSGRPHLTHPDSIAKKKTPCQLASCTGAHASMQERGSKTCQGQILPDELPFFPRLQIVLGWGDWRGAGGSNPRHPNKKNLGGGDRTCKWQTLESGCGCSTQRRHGAPESPLLRVGWVGGGIGDSLLPLGSPRSSPPGPRSLPTHPKPPEALTALG